MLDRFTPTARRAVIHAGLLAREAGRSHLDDEALLIALARSSTVAARLGATGAQIQQLVRRPAPPTDRELLATLGIDLDEVRRRLADRTDARLDDPRRWRLRRPPLLPLRVTLVGPATELVLTEPARKVVEVAMNLRGYGPVVTEDALLRGILADHRTGSVAALRRLGLDLRGLARDLFARPVAS